MCIAESKLGPDRPGETTGDVGGDRYAYVPVVPHSTAARSGIFSLPGDPQLDGDEEKRAATDLIKINALSVSRMPWKLSFSYGRFSRDCHQDVVEQVGK